MPSSLSLPFIILATFFPFLSAFYLGLILIFNHLSDSVNAGDAELTLAVILTAVMQLVTILLEGTPTTFSNQQDVWARVSKVLSLTVTGSSKVRRVAPLQALETFEQFPLLDHTYTPLQPDLCS